MKQALFLLLFMPLSIFGQSVGTNVFKQDEPHPFWNSAMGRIKLENSTMILDDEKALERTPKETKKIVTYLNRFNNNFTN